MYTNKNYILIVTNEVSSVGIESKDFWHYTWSPQKAELTAYIFLSLHGL